MAGVEPILLIGATRGTGLLIARLLLEQERPVRILARDPTRAVRLFGSAAEVIPGDITKASTLDAAVAGATDIIFTAGCRSGHPVGPRQIRRTEYGGVVNTLAATSRRHFAGRFLYMTSSGVHARSFWTLALNLYKGNTLRWRSRAEAVIRASGLAYTIIRTGMLMNAPAGTRAIEVTQQELPLSPRYRIARADVAAAFVAALDHPRTRRATFELVWGRKNGGRDWASLFAHLQPDALSEDDANG